MKVLFKIDSLIFENWISQILILCLWVGVVLSPSGWWTYWVLTGIVAYLVLTLKNFSEGVEKERQYLSQTYTSMVFFPFLKDLTTVSY